MHNAPSVTYPVGRSHFLGLCLALLVMMNVALTGVWTWRQGGVTWPQAFAWWCCGLSAWAALRSWRRMPVGYIRWDGQAWQLLQASESAPGALRMQIDGQTRCLLRWHAEGGAPCWIWVEKGAATGAESWRWLALRRAIFARARPEPGAQRMSS